MVASKEATVYIVDVGKSMGRKENGRKQNNLDWSMQYILDKMTTTVYGARKTQQLGVLTVGSDETRNIMGEEEGFEHINELLPIQQCSLQNVKDLYQAIKPSQSSSGDVISALVVAIEMIERHTKKQKWLKNIVLVTDGARPMDADDIEQIAEKLLGDSIQLTVLGVDFDDAEFGFKEEDKDPIKARNEEALRKLCEACDGNYGTMAYAISELVIPRIDQPGLKTSYKGPLTLGDSSKYDTAITIMVERYPKVKLAKAPTASSFVAKTEGGTQAGSSTQTSATMQNGNSQAHAESGLTAVKQARTYAVDDPDAPGGKRELEKDSLARGYTYGSTAVPMEQEDEHVTKLDTIASFEIIGFVAAEEYEHWMGMKETSQIVPNKLNKKSAMALSSLIHALHERSSFAVARLVVEDGKGPVLVMMAPFFDPENNYECLIDVELPFAEDMRSFSFPPLDKIVKVSGDTIKQHRNLPNENLMSAMSDYVDAMDLSTFGRDEGSQPTEYAAIIDTYNTRKNYMEQAVKFRAINPVDPVPPPAEILLRYTHPPPELIDKAKSQLATLVKAADVKKVPPKLKGRKRGRDVEKPLSGLDVQQLLNRDADGNAKRAKRQIDPNNAIPGFKQYLEQVEDDSSVKVMEAACQQLGAIIEGYVRDSTGNSAYQRAIEAMRVMKEEMMEYEEPRLYNDFLRGFKEKLVKGELGEGRASEVWYRVKVHKLGLIDSGNNELADATPDEAKEFLRLN